MFQSKKQFWLIPMVVFFCLIVKSYCYQSDKQDIPVEVFTHVNETNKFETAFSPDGKYLAIPGEKCLQIWDWQTGALIDELDMPGADYMAFSNDGNYLAACERFDYRVLKLWNFPKRKEILSVDGYKSPNIWGDLIKVRYYDLELTPDSKYLLALQTGGIINLWDLKRLRRIYIFDALVNLVDIEISPDGQWLGAIGGGLEGRYIFIWELSTKKLIQKIEIDRNHPLLSLAFSPDSKRITCSSTNVIFVYDIASGKEIKHSQELDGYVDYIIYSPNGKYLVCVIDITMLNKDWFDWPGRWRADLAIFEVETLNCIKRYHNQVELSDEMNANGRYDHVAFTPNGQHMCVICEGKTVVWKTPKILYEDSK